MPHSEDNRLAYTSIPDLVRRLAQDGDRLVRAELRQAQAEVVGKARSALPGIAALMVGSIFLLASLFTLLPALIGWLAPQVGAGNAALIVTLGAALSGGALVAIGGSSLKNIGNAPHAVERPAADAKPVPAIKDVTE